MVICAKTARSINARNNLLSLTAKSILWRLGRRVVKRVVKLEVRLPGRTKVLPMKAVMGFVKTVNLTRG